MRGCLRFTGYIPLWQGISVAWRALSLVLVGVVVVGMIFVYAGGFEMG